jgi:heat shock protein HslJ
MSNSRFVFGLLVIASLAIGCTTSSLLPTSPSPGSGPAAQTADQLAGTWTLRSIQPAGQADQATPPGASYTLTIADGRLSTRADCNLCNGAFTLSGQTVTAGPALACTRAACPTMAFESSYTRLLSGDSTIMASGNTLVLSSSRGTLRFTR